MSDMTQPIIAKTAPIIAKATCAMTSRDSNDPAKSKMKPQYRVSKPSCEKLGNAICCTSIVTALVLVYKFCIESF
jgi:hypothetical protein